MKIRKVNNSEMRKRNMRFQDDTKRSVAFEKMSLSDEAIYSKKKAIILFCCIPIPSCNTYHQLIVLMLRRDYLGLKTKKKKGKKIRKTTKRSFKYYFSHTIINNNNFVVTIFHFPILTLKQNY